jgi:lysophospholipase L1-like esterase
MIELVRTLGPANGAPKIYTAIPPPLMQQGAYGMNQSVINDVFPVLVPAINKDNNVGTEPIDVFTALGGDKDWKTTYPKSCSLQTASDAKCPLFCDKQSCDQCHPDNDGYTTMAAAMKKGLGL